MTGRLCGVTSDEDAILSDMLTVVRAESPDDIASVRALFTEYQTWLGQAVCSKRLAEEIATLPGPYAPPRGALLLGKDGDGRAAGCVGIREHTTVVAEMKRLFVRPQYRRQGLARDLVLRAVDAASAAGYRRVVLTTLPDLMAAALDLYLSLGFRQMQASDDLMPIGSTTDVFFMALDIDV